jgi:hypothetical protein
MKGSVGDAKTSATAGLATVRGGSIERHPGRAYEQHALLYAPTAQLVTRIGECVAALAPDIVTIGKSMNTSMTQGLEANRESTIISFFRDSTGACGSVQQLPQRLVQIGQS